ncbi:hypothetical protein JOC36_001751 [Weissella uvarum]|uniref:hypothetical protein n=1 Tax=Weissella uvarum TaxID=1479233 RepID=UPI0019608829|nr:hypothetical protein [Weissella uvarum]MBM7618147.1 hypothetical protein [Weissella uvarum]MCM0595244.1 hypothetical protein [Weissella uvarum]
MNDKVISMQGFEFMSDSQLNTVVGGRKKKWRKPYPGYHVVDAVWSFGRGFLGI